MLEVLLLLLPLAVDLSHCSLSDVFSTNQCDLKLLCSIIKTEDPEYSNLKSILQGDPGAGVAGVRCEELSPQCPLSSTELLEVAAASVSASINSGNRSRRSVVGLPPAITILGQNPQCRQCEVKGSLCLLFGVGSFKACNLLPLLLGGPAGQLCGAVALPVRIACAANTIKCYARGCGLLRLPNIKLPGN